MYTIAVILSVQRIYLIIQRSRLRSRWFSSALS